MEATDKSNYFMTEKPPEAFIDLILSLQIAANNRTCFNIKQMFAFGSVHGRS